MFGVALLLYFGHFICTVLWHMLIYPAVHVGGCCYNQLCYVSVALLCEALTARRNYYLHCHIVAFIVRQRMGIMAPLCC